MLGDEIGIESAALLIFPIVFMIPFIVLLLQRLDVLWVSIDLLFLSSYSWNSFSYSSSTKVYINSEENHEMVVGSVN
jgi:hypothetical protein